MATRKPTTPIPIPGPKTDNGRYLSQCMPSGVWAQASSTSTQPSSTQNSLQDDYVGPLMADLPDPSVADPIQRMLEDDHKTHSSHQDEAGLSANLSSDTDTGISDPSFPSTNPSVDDSNAHHILPLSSSTEVTRAEQVYAFRRKVSDMNLRKLSSKLSSEWMRLATYLHFEEADIFRFQNKYSVLDDCIFFMLTTWRCHQSRGATVNVLAEALEKCGRKDLADEMRGHSSQDEEPKVLPKHVPNQIYNNLLADLCDMTEQKRRKMAMLIRQDPLSGDGASLEERDGRPPQVPEIVSCLERNNYLGPNNVWYLMYLLLQLEQKYLYEQVWRYACKRNKKHQPLTLHWYSEQVKSNHCIIRYKITGNTEHFGGMHLAEFQAMLAEKFEGEVRYINSVGAQKGCIEIYLQMPQEYKEKAVQMAKEEAKWLLGKHVMSVEVMGEEVIHLSTYHDDDETVELSKEMQLLQCILDNDRQELEQLLTDGACPNYKVGGKWLLQWAVFTDEEGDKEEFVRLLLEHGADRDAKDEMNTTAVEEAKFLGRCRRELTFTPKKPVHTYVKKEDRPYSSFVPRLTAENIQIHSVFLIEKRQYACIPCQKVWLDHVWGYHPHSHCKGCGTPYHPLPKGHECPRKRVMCESCDLVFMTWMHPCITKRCRHCRKPVVDCPPFGTTLPCQSKKPDVIEGKTLQQSSQSHSPKFIEIVGSKVWHGLEAVKSLTRGACL